MLPAIVTTGATTVPHNRPILPVISGRSHPPVGQVLNSKAIGCLLHVEGRQSSTFQNGVFRLTSQNAVQGDGITLYGVL